MPKLISEEEAKKLWCRHAQVSSNLLSNPAIEIGKTNIDQINAYNRKEKSLNCLGSRCMSWEKVDPMDEESDIGFCLADNKQVIIKSQLE